MRLTGRKPQSLLRTNSLCKTPQPAQLLSSFFAGLQKQARKGLFFFTEIG
jgi:hypothetical protein